MKTRKHLAFLVTIAMVVSLVFTGAAADAPEEGLWLRGVSDSSGPGWNWHEDSKTLTLDGLNILEPDGAGIYLPEGSTIVLEEDSVNSVTSQDGHGIWAEGSLTIQGAGTLIIEAKYSGITTLKSLDIDGVELLDIDAGGDGLIIGGAAPQAVLLIEDPVELEPNLSISNTGEVKIVASGRGIEVPGTTNISDVGSLDINVVRYGIYTGDDISISDVTSLNIIAGYTGIKAFGDLSISNVGQFDMTVAEDGIDLYGDLYFETVDWMKIVAEDDGIYLDGDLFMEDIDWLYIDAGDYGIYTSQRGNFGIKADMPSEDVSGGQITLGNMGSIEIYTDLWGIYASAGITIIDVTSMIIDAGAGIYANAGLLMSDIGVAEITGDDGIVTEGVTEINSINSLTVNALSSDGGAIAAFERLSLEDIDNLEVNANNFGLISKDITVSQVGSLAITSSIGILAASLTEDGPDLEDAEGVIVHMAQISQAEFENDYIGIVSFGKIVIEECADLAVDATHGEPFAPDGPLPAAIIALNDSITIRNSTVHALGHYFGIMTGFILADTELNGFATSERAPFDIQFSGGDIIISRSFVIAEADAEIGYAGIFAGDNLEPEDPDKSQIIIDDASVIDPEEYWIVNVDIDGTNSQSITAMAIELITEWVQAANYVEIAVDTYTVTYDANGGSGTLVDPDSPYYVGDTVTVLDSTFTLEDYSSFESWNTAADGSGTEYQPGDTLVIESDIVLYAQYVEVEAEDEDEDEDEDIIPIPETSDATGTLLPGLFILLAAAVVLKKTMLCKQNN